jgi:N-acetylglucosaminyldiphosphoundecaprenol N-acetyl-beta-D-mannosaminyltransferase
VTLPSRAVAGKPKRIQIGGLPVDTLTFDQAVDEILRVVEAGNGGAIFTPNVDHVVRAEHDEAFRGAYRDVALSIVDGMPLVWASHLIGSPLPQKISGSDWFEPLIYECSRRGHSVYLLGGREQAGSISRHHLQGKYPGLIISGIGPRTKDIESDRNLLDRACQEIRATRPTFAVVALGSPLQELWAAEVRASVAPTVLLGLGSVLDLTAGLIVRAPRWMSQLGLEWLFRLSHDPRRLWRRYLVRGPEFLVIVLRQMFQHRQGVVRG